MPDSGSLLQFDKIAHFAVFAILSFLMTVGFTKQHTIQRIRHHAPAFSISISSVYAVGLEISQALVPDRNLNAIDLVANISGVLTGYLLFLLIYKLSFG